MHRLPLHTLAALCIPASHLSFCEYKFQGGSAMIPHPRKSTRGGEDAAFCKVSAWMEDDGIDAGIFAFSLSHFTKKASKRLSPQKAVEEALAKTTVPGSATACVVKLHTNGNLETFTLGDSGFLLLREKPRELSRWYNFLAFIRKQEEHPTNAFYIVEQSLPMMHDDENNLPFQLGSQNAPTRDTPETAQIHNIQTCAGDVIILATDGLFDNLSNAEIVHYINNFEMDDNNIAFSKQLAWLLASKAHKKYDVIDDISVVVAHVVVDEE